MRVPWTAKRLNQSILKEINPEYPLEGLMLKLKLQSFGHLMWTKDSGKGSFPGLFGKDPFPGLLEKTLMLRKTEGRRRGWQRMKWLAASPTQWAWVWTISGRRWKTRKPGVLQFMGSQRVGHDSGSELNWKGWTRWLKVLYCDNSSVYYLKLLRYMMLALLISWFNNETELTISKRFSVSLFSLSAA